MFRQAKPLADHISPVTAERLADALFEIGKGQLVQGDYAMAIKWLQRASDIMDKPTPESLSRDAVELRLAVTQLLFDALLAEGSSDGAAKAESLTVLLEDEMGDKAIVQLMRLELLQSRPPDEFDLEAYVAVLRRMVRTFIGTESAFRLLLHHIRELHRRSPILGTSVLDEFLHTRIVKSECIDWMEKLVIGRVSMAAAVQQGEADAVNELLAALEKLQERISEPFGPSCAVAVLSVCSTPVSKPRMRS